MLAPRLTRTTVTCMLRLFQVRAAPIRQLSLLASSDAEAIRHARLLSGWPNVHAISIQRRAEWLRGETQATAAAKLRILGAEQRRKAADAVVGSLPAALRSLIIGEFALTNTTWKRLGRYAAAQRHGVRSQFAYAWALIAACRLRQH